mmetsp:Transcript_98692/g.263899  ORF Transcript_98692/g.263899 Transcript_98692/m.263899 type:complete len:210 (+) Transcript_98692:880-1509(+)
MHVTSFRNGKFFTSWKESSFAANKEAEASLETVTNRVPWGFHETPCAILVWAFHCSTIFGLAVVLRSTNTTSPPIQATNPRLLAWCTLTASNGEVNPVSSATTPSPPMFTTRRILSTDPVSTSEVSELSASSGAQSTQVMLVLCRPGTLVSTPVTQTPESSPISRCTISRSSLLSPFCPPPSSGANILGTYIPIAVSSMPATGSSPSTY